MFDRTRAVLTRFGVIGEVLALPWRAGRLSLLLPVLLLGLGLLARESLRLAATACSDLVGVRRRRRERIEQAQLREESKSLYPLW